jgi:hypothetical protein
MAPFSQELKPPQNPGRFKDLGSDVVIDRHNHEESNLPSSIEAGEIGFQDERTYEHSAVGNTVTVNAIVARLPYELSLPLRRALKRGNCHHISRDVNERS